MLRTSVAAVFAIWTSVSVSWGQNDNVSLAQETKMTTTLATLQPVNLVYAEATGSFLVLLAIAQQQRFFEKHGVEIQATGARGATVPRLTNDIPVGFIGEPAAILQAADGNDVRIVASFSRTPLSGHLAGRPHIRSAADLRGKRIGVRVLGAGLWISTILALEQLGLSPGRDEIVFVPVGSPAEILRALEEGAIDAALLPLAESRRLSALGYQILLSNYPAGITAYGGALVVTPAYLQSHPEIVEKIIAALAEALVFTLVETNSAPVMQAFGTSLGITNRETMRSNLRELLPKPYPSRAALESMQRVMSLHDPRVLTVSIDELIDQRLVEKLDRVGVFDQTAKQDSALIRCDAGCEIPTEELILGTKSPLSCDQLT